MGTNIFVNGKIFTANDEKPWATTMEVTEGVITYIGEERQSDRKDSGNGTDNKIVDLGGRTVIPGFVDSHMHLSMVADRLKQICCLPPEITSIDDIVHEIAKEAGTYKRKGETGRWIEGWGFDEGKIKEGRLPGRYDLDRGTEDYPVVITRSCEHICSVNSKCLELSGITRDTPNPPGGEIDRDEEGNPTGILRENARDLVNFVLPKKTSEEQIRNILEVGELLSSQGITAISDMGNLNGEDDYNVFSKAIEEGVEQHVAMYYLWDYFVDKSDFPEKFAMRRENGGIKMAGLKLIGDGSVSGRTAWMSTPYLSKASGQEEYGMAVCSDQLINSAMDFCREQSCDLSIHAMGGAAIDRVVDMVCGTGHGFDGCESRLRVEHVTEPGDEAISKAAEKGIYFVTQPIFLYAEIESYLNNLDVERMKRTYPIKKLLRRGVNVALSTDAPATAWPVPTDPMVNIKAAVTRRAYNGVDCGVQQAISVEEAIILYTRESAKAVGFQGIGELKEGMRGDFVVLSDDIFTVDSETIDGVKVLATWIGGRRVFGEI